ncbi:MAG TPA: homoserine dehydrogenase, partial [Limnochordales bacterium]
MAASEQPIRLGMLGFGTVGQAVARALARRADDIAARTGRPIVLRRVAVRDPAKPRPVALDGVAVHRSPLEVVEQPDVDLLVEVMGGEEPAASAIRRALELGKPVVTANKVVMARRGPELLELARRQGVPLLFEAAVGGAVPIIRPVQESLASDRILALWGIVNGTTNFILTEMTDQGAAFEEALQEAQRRGYAEADPSADVSGFDAACKLAVLASLAFDRWLVPEQIDVRGLEGITARDVQYAGELGLEVKLLAFSRLEGDAIEAWVGPAMLPRRHPLAQVRGVNNAIWLVTESAGELMFYGPGAGGDPTAAAVLGDVMDVARRHAGRNGAEGRDGRAAGVRAASRPARVVEPARASARFYLRLQVADRPGVLAAIAAVFGRHGVSIESVIQKGRG